MNVFDKFDFDEWAKLAKENPEEFDRQRQLAVDGVINSAAPTQRQSLRQTQFLIDSKRAVAKTPLESCLSVTELMWNKVEGDGGFLDCLNALQTGKLPLKYDEEVREQMPKADVLRVDFGNSSESRDEPRPRS